MAAVLCGGIGKACQGCCDCVGAICMAPFKLCGACCEGCGQCCSSSCSLITNCCNSNFCFYITVTCALNIPPIVVGLTDLPNVADGCSGSIWLLVFWILCAVNIVAAFYMSRAVDNDDSILPPTGQQNDMSHFQQNAENGVGRIKHLFCYDMWMAVYILILFGYFGWLLLGAAWFISDTMDDQESCDNIAGRVGIAYGFGWTFVFMGGCALCVSLCCGVFNGTSTNQYSNGPPPQQQANTATAAASATPAAAASAAGKDDKKHYGSTTSNPTTVNPHTPSAPAEAEIPVASATPIYGDAKV